MTGSFNIITKTTVYSVGDLQCSVSMYSFAVTQIKQFVK